MSNDLIQKKDQNTALLIAIDELNKVAAKQNVFFAVVEATKVNLMLENEVINEALKAQGVETKQSNCFGNLLGIIITKDNTGL